METKNQYIEQYIKSVSAQVNNQYGKELIDNDKISRALIMFRDSSEDLETEIIPKINKFQANYSMFRSRYYLIR